MTGPESNYFDYSNAPEYTGQKRTDAGHSPSSWELVEAFRDAIAAEGLGRPEVVPDDKLHRFHCYGDSAGTRNGWAILFMDGKFAAGAFGTWKGGLKFEWNSFNDSEISEEEREAFRLRMEEAKRQREEARVQRQDEVSNEVTATLSGCTFASSHPYLDRKQVGAHGIATNGRELLVPMMDGAGRVWSVQKIQPDGSKFFEAGGRVHGMHFRIDGKTDRVFLCEGYSTGATVFEATGSTVYIAFNAGNLKPVLDVIREHYPLAPVVIAADNDQWIPEEKGGNVGKKKAEEAAQKDPNCLVVLPKFRDESQRPTDFNDLYCQQGIEAVQVQLGGSSSLKVVNFGYFLDNEFVGRPLIHGLVETGQSLLIIGDSNVGKSLVTLFIALHIGQFAGPKGLNLAPLWGRYPIDRQIKTLFVQSENASRSTKRRLELMVAGNPLYAEAARNSLFTELRGDDCRTVGSFSDKAFLDRLKAIIECHGIEHVVFDPLISYHGQDENDNAAMRRSLDCLSLFMGQTGCTSTIVHHRGKDGSKGGRGASSIRDWSDSALIFEAPNKRENWKIRVTPDKLRDGGDFNPFWVQREDSLLFTPMDPPQKEGAEEDLAIVEEVIAAIIELGGKASAPEIALKMGEPRRSIYRKLDKGTELGMLEMAQEGRKKLYSIKGKGGEGDVPF